jgi:hypothetical protein
MRCGPHPVNPLLAIIFKNLRSAKNRLSGKRAKLVSYPIQSDACPREVYSRAAGDRRPMIAESCNSQTRALLGDRLIRSREN